jgi:hypothetical protein
MMVGSWDGPPIHCEGKEGAGEKKGERSADQPQSLASPEPDNAGTSHSPQI